MIDNCEHLILPGISFLKCDGTQMTTKELESRLEKCLWEEDFEYAQVIQEEINRRNGE